MWSTEDIGLLVVMIAGVIGLSVMLVCVGNYLLYSMAPEIQAIEDTWNAVLNLSEVMSDEKAKNATE